MRIISGKFRGVRLETPAKSVAGVRPSMDRVREGIFSVLCSYFDFSDAVILDLFAGSGSYGFECLSRGSSKVVFIDKLKICVDILKSNSGRLGVSQHTQIIKSTVDEFLFKERKEEFAHKFDLIFADPPYGKESYNRFLNKIQESGFLKKNSIIVFEDLFPNLKQYSETQNNTMKEEIEELGFKFIKIKKYSGTGVIFAQYLGN